MKKLFSLLAMAVLCLASVCGQSKLSNWSTMLVEQKKQMTKEQFLNTSLTNVTMDNGREMVDCYVHFKDAIDVNILPEYGAKLLTTFEGVNIVTAAVPVIALEALSQNEQVLQVEVAMPAEFKLDKARQMSMVDAALIGQGQLQHEFKGEGVLVGVVDQELQYAHPAFWNKEHNRFRIKKVWNQQREGNPPAGFYYGYEYVDSADIMNAKYDLVYVSKAESGHATHVMGIAAGADYTLPYYGIAQKSDIVFVSCPGYSYDNIPSGIKYIFGKATEMGKPCVVNVSMGGWQGPHDGTSTESRIIDNLVGPGRIVCASAGNEGDAKIHCNMSFSATDTLAKTSYQQVKSGDPFYIDVWGSDTGVNYQIRAVVYDKDSMMNRYESSWCNAIPGNATNQQIISINQKLSIYSSNDLNVTGSLVGSKSIYNKRGNVAITFTTNSLPNRCIIGFEVKATDGTVHMFTSEQVGSFTSAGGKKFGFTDGNTDMTVCEPSGVTKNVVSVGAYVSYAKSGYGKEGAKASFSSMGPTVDGRVKPDISAPGQTLMSAFPDFGSIKSDRATSTVVDGQTYYYAYMQGTSMSSPYAAGTIALWLEADSTLDYDGIIDVFQHSCILDENTGSVPNNSWGWGKINAYYGLLYILGYTVGVEDVTKPTVLGVYEDGQSDIFRIGFAKNMSDLTLRVVDMSGRVVYTSAEGDIMAGQEVTVDLSNMAPGMYVINVGGENYKVVR